MQDYFDNNKKLWNAKVPIHVNSVMYNMEAFMAGETSLDKATLDLVGDIKGKKILHLQCHFGQDTLSMARMGATVTGLDISNEAIEKAKALNVELDLDAQFIESNVYDAIENVEGKFDIVFASYGTICWLPDLDKWATVIAHFLKPKGKFVFLDFHPLIDMLNWDTCDFEFGYFNPGKPHLEFTQGTYADTNANIKMKEYFWNHSIAEVIQALLTAGLQIEQMKEYDYSPYDVFGEMIERAPREYTMKKMPVDFPYFYGIICNKL